MMTRNWSIQEQVAALMRLPWTLRVGHDTDGSLIVQVEEIPDAIGTGMRPKQAAIDLWESLTGSLEIRLEHGDPIPLPKGSSLPWEAADQSSTRRVARTIRQREGQLTVQLSATAA